MTTVCITTMTAREFDALLRACPVGIAPTFVSREFYGSHGEREEVTFGIDRKTYLRLRGIPCESERWSDTVGAVGGEEGTYLGEGIHEGWMHTAEGVRSTRIPEEFVRELRA